VGRQRRMTAVMRVVSVGELHEEVSSYAR
jgi:hypothetical protein